MGEARVTPSTVGFGRIPIIGTSANIAALNNATTMSAACRPVRALGRSAQSPANAATINPAVAASMASRLNPINQNSGSATTL